MDRVKSRREEYSEATRQALIDSATGLFAEKGFAKTSLDEVAAAARLTKGALYWHFANKAALFRAVFEDLETKVVERIVTAAATSPNAWDACLAAVSTFLDACCDPVYGAIVMREGPVAMGYEQWRLCEDEFMYGHTAGLLQGLVDGGYVDPLPIEASTRVAFGMLAAAALAIAESEGPAQAQMRADMEQVLLAFLEGRRKR